ncbi:organic cation transporter [Anopheles sinensis]|uniref:Organic cation transporter n=1 Tax=Anopheles sinensis TaxID=74873 RepID=A0A084WN23_ANOSI|nr:organic cation transporter [Anopheles sinensis]
MVTSLGNVVACFDSVVLHPSEVVPEDSRESIVLTCGCVQQTNDRMGRGEWIDAKSLARPYRGTSNDSNGFPR